MKRAADAMKECNEAYKDLRAYSGTPQYLAMVTFLVALEDYYSAETIECAEPNVAKFRGAARTIAELRRSAQDREGKTSFTL
jgi:hypothetical protein